jgi:hypothetical protein
MPFCAAISLRHPRIVTISGVQDLPSQLSCTRPKTADCVHISALLLTVSFIFLALQHLQNGVKAM